MMHQSGREILIYKRYKTTASIQIPHSIAMQTYLMTFIQSTHDANGQPCCLITPVLVARGHWFISESFLLYIVQSFFHIV